MFGAISADLIMEVARMEGYMEQLPLFETPPEYTIDPNYLTSVPVTYGWISSTGTPCSTMSTVDHPSFTALREHLGATGYIKIERGWHNGDQVLKPFFLNDVEFVTGKKFCCASAMKYHIEFAKRKQK